MQRTKWIYQPAEKNVNFNNMLDLYGAEFYLCEAMHFYVTKVIHF